MSVPRKTKFASLALRLAPLANAAGYATFYDAAADVMNVQINTVKYTIDRIEFDAVRNTLCEMVS